MQSCATVDVSTLWLAHGGIVENPGSSRSPTVLRVEPARELWKRIETVHAVTYFAPESTTAATSAGLRGFWMGYFGFRAAPLGAVGPGVVEAAFANFAPQMVRRSIPDAWDFAQPANLIAVRSTAAAEALRRLAPDVSTLATHVNDVLHSIVDAAAPIGRPLFAANRDVAPLEDPVAQLWQHCTTLREHRGDGHVLALAAADINGCQAHQLLIAAQHLPVEVFRENRGWTDQEWDHAGQQLHERGLIHDQALTSAGRRVHAEIERLTDALAYVPIARSLAGNDVSSLIEALTATALEVSTSGVLPFPNPMGLPTIASS